MQIKTTYKGYINGIYGIYCGFKPESLEVEQEVSVYYPDEGKVFVKNDEKYSVVVLQGNESIEDYQEVVDKKEEENDIITK